MSALSNAALWFFAIVALIPIALWLVKRSPVGAAASTGGTLRQVASLPLSAQQRVVTVEVGSGDDRQWLVLGVTPHSIRTLHAMAPQAETPNAGAATPSAAFAHLLKRLRQGGDDRAPR